MIHLFVNALAASAGGGLTYVRNVVPHLAARNDVRATVLLDARLRAELRSYPNIAFVEVQDSPGTLHRFWFEQSAMRDLLRNSGANILLSAGNFALWNSPVSQILLSRNSLYTSGDFFSDLRSRGETRLWLDTKIKGVFAKWSINAADCVVAPSDAFAEELRRWTGKPVLSIHHGFDREAFVFDRSPLSHTVRAKLDCGGSALRLLFVSHYNYYRNFETLIRALPFLRGMLGRREIRLFLTCQLSPRANPGVYRSDSATELVRRLGLSESIVELGSVPYRVLHHVYRTADVYVTPAYAESFAHPLVEAMSMGLPVVASDIAVHQEICGPAAVYFHRFSPQELARRILEVVESSELAAQLSQAGVERSAAFSWSIHVDQVLSLARRLVLQAC